MNAKLKSSAALTDLIGSFPRQRRVVLCHGVFDIIHPGHIRHLTYAKSKADILVCSVTADVHIDKGAHRPHCPQELRAEALACLEMVDYVMIDPNATPVENIKRIKPDYYAKGYEYESRNVPESAAVESYGGEMLFTPGDIVYSTTKIVDRDNPRLAMEKLALLVEREKVDFTLPDFALTNVHVIGDRIVDTITHCTMIGSSGKTPTLSVRRVSSEQFKGGAEIVYEHLHAAGAMCMYSSPDWRATIKNVFEVDGYRMLKVDEVDNSPISDAQLEKLCTRVNRIKVDAVIFSDFRHGIFNRRTIDKLIAAIPAGTFKAADSQVASRWGNILDFKGFDLITPNEKEARFALGDQDSPIRSLSSHLYEQSKCKTLMMKLGANGVIAQCGPESEFIVLDSFARQVVDPVGAGDAFLAYATLGMLTGSPAKAVLLGSIAAGLECEQNGNVPITREMMEERLDETRTMLRG